MSYHYSHEGQFWSVRKISLYQFQPGFVSIRLRNQAMVIVEKLGG